MIITALPHRKTRFAFGLLAAVLAAAAVGCGPGDPPAGFFFFTIAEGTPVDVELTAVDAAPDTSISMKLGEDLLETPGQTALIGVAIEGLHTHPEWLATIPGGTPIEDFTFSLSFRLNTTAPEYATSDEYTVQFELVAEAPEEPEETEILLGSNLDGGGQIVARYDFATPIPLFFDQCLGGSGDDCSGGTAVYSATNPGFAPQE
jgi:hypothetical protein